MATEFNLPDSPPPGNTFPVATKTGGQRASVVTLSKGLPRAIVVEVKEERSPRSSEEEEMPTRQTETAPSACNATTRSEDSFTPTPDRSVSRSRPHPQLQIHTGPMPPPPQPQGSHSQASSMTLHDNHEEEPAAVVVTAAEDDHTEQTPVMRSMFPRFDPEVRMSRQDYVPPVELLPPPPPLLPGMRSSRPNSQVSVYVPAQSSPMPSPSPYLTPQRVMSPPAPPLDRADQELSAPEELLDLWTIANGQLCPEAKESYVLGLEW